MSKAKTSKDAKKPKGSAKSGKSNTLFTEEDKGPHAVVVADLNTRRFDPLTRTVPHCLLPLGNVPLLHYTLARLITDGFRNIIVYACAHANQVRQFIESSQLNRDPVRITVHNGEGCRSLGDAMRDLDAAQALHGIVDFLLVPADLMCATSLLSFVRRHEERRSRNPNAILSLVLPRSPPILSAVQAAELTVSVLLAPTADNRIIKLLSACANPSPSISLQELLRSESVVELSSDLIDIGVAVCSNHVAPLFQDNFDYQTMGDLIHDVLTNEEVMGYTMHVDRVPPGPLVLCAAPDLRSLIEFGPHLLAQDLGIRLPSSGDVLPSNRDSLVAVGPQVYVSRSAVIDPTARVIGTCLIGPGCQIGPGAVLVDCVLGADCRVGTGARLRRVVALDAVHLGDGVLSDTAWICAHAVVHRGVRLPFCCFIGPAGETETPVTLGPGPGRLSARSVIVAPGTSDLVLDPCVGGAQVWAALYTGKQRASGQTSTEDYSDDSSGDADDLDRLHIPNDPSGSSGGGGCALWDTAEDRIRSAAAKLRRSAARARGQSSTSEYVTMSGPRRASAKLTRKSGRTVSTAGADTDPDRLSGPSEEDEGEQSEAFLVGELRHTLEHSQASQSTDDATENVILEVNSLKHAYNIPIEDLYFLLTKAVLDLTRMRCQNTSAGESALVDKAQVRAYVQEFKTQLARFHSVLSSYMANSVQSAGRLCLQAVEDSACYCPLIMESSPFVVHAMYDQDLITEDAIWWWVEHSPLLADDDLARETAAMREKLKPFLNWLREAESEDEDEENESGSD